MYKTEKEIFSQYKALEKTFDYFTSKTKAIHEFKGHKHFTSVTYIGSGSGYCLCQSGEVSAKIRLGIPANSMAAGDLMLNFPHYRKVIEDTLLIAPSRSGSTSEVVIAVKKAREQFGVPCVSICAKEGAELNGMADLGFEIPWANDESVCQTRTITNLYTSNLLFIGILQNDQLLVQEIEKAIEDGDDYINRYTDPLKEIALNGIWDKVVVLGDSELQGIAAEAAVAFKEIPQIPSNYHHILDVRHGPMVLIDDKTLVIMACSPYGESYQGDLVDDLKNRGAYVVTVGTEKMSALGSDYHVSVPCYQNYGVMGIPFIFVPQVIAYFRAVKRGINPDLPDGLDPWIKL